MLSNELVLGLEQALEITYSIVVSEFIDSDSLFLTKHCPPHAATAAKLQSKSCLAVLSERTVQAFLDTVDQAYGLDPLTMVTVVVPVPCGDPPPAPLGWHAIRYCSPGTTSGSVKTQSAAYSGASGRIWYTTDVAPCLFLSVRLQEILA